MKKTLLYSDMTGASMNPLMSINPISKVGLVST